MASTDEQDRHDRRVALVTGGGRGIGEEIATALAADGYNVCVAARTGDELDTVVEDITRSGGTARAYQVDLREPAEVDDLVDAVVRDEGDVDILVNNAGIGGGGQPFWESDPDAWWEVLEVNLRAPMRLSHRVLDGMIERDSGYLINVTSLAGARPAPMTSAYGVSKAALARLGDSIAQGLRDAGHGVTVFSVSPGLVRTEMTSGVPFFESLPEEAWTPVEAIGELVCELVGGAYDDLSGRFIHVDFDLDRMQANSEEIADDGLYILRLPGLDGLIE